jgi:hypothetical protein
MGRNASRSSPLGKDGSRCGRVPCPALPSMGLVGHRTGSGEGEARCRLVRRRCLGASGGVGMGRLVEVADTKLYVQERGEPSAFPPLVFHGGPGLDHAWFGDYLDPLTEGGSYRLVPADERA